MEDFKRRHLNKLNNQLKQWRKYILNFTQEDKNEIIDYYLSQSQNAKVKFTQKVYAEAILGHIHDIWDVHATDGRWWVITNPTNLYSQDQFPNMDLAMTFHVGLCLRIPRNGRENQDTSKLILFNGVLQAISDCDDALTQANDEGAYRAIGVRCRENLLAFVHATQKAFDWGENTPKKSDFVAWTDLICNTVKAGSRNKERRHLVKSGLKQAWTYVNWLTHSKSGNWIDAEMATTTVSHTLNMAILMVIRYFKGIPDQCPECKSQNFYAEEGMNTELPEVIFERPICSDCGWAGDPIPIGERTDEETEKFIIREGEINNECGIMSTPLMEITRPKIK